MAPDSEHEHGDEADCPGCGEAIRTVDVAQLRGRRSNTAAKFWTCPECGTILGPAV